MRSSRAVSAVIAALLSVAMVRAATGADQLISGRRLLMLDTASGDQLKFLSKDAIVAPPSGGPDDPTAVGATLTLSSGLSNETATFSLPAANWSVNASATRYRYRNPQAPGGPSGVDTVIIKGGKRLKASAKATGLTLDEPGQGSIRVTITSGTRRYLAEFGGTVLRDELGRFLAVDAPPPSAIQITSPAAGTTITDYAVLVRGTLLGAPPDAGVSVNGTVAVVEAADFAAIVPTEPGAVTALTATLTAPDGTVLGQHSIPVTVQPPATPPVLFFRVSPIMGTAPFVAAFTLTSTEPVQSLSLDADGDGLADHTGQDLDDVRFTYATPGLYFPTVTAVDAQSATHEATATVRVFSSAELDALILPRWTALKDALRLGNVAGALQYVAARRRTYFETMFNSLSVPLSQIDQMLGDLEFVTQRGLNVEYEMTRQEGGQTYRYAVIFVMDEDGIWRLRAL